MRPISLDIEGVNSFEAKQSIDFEKLLSGGIFGIFGNTGSGKSTILDSITLALYGCVERADKNEDFINNRTGRAAVSFRFSSGGAKPCVYEAAREFKKGRTGNISAKAALYEVRDGEKYQVADGPKAVGEKIYEIIGLDLKDFQKCIALPQGEFAAFVKSTRAERLNIIARLFSLEVFGDGIYKKVRERCDGLNLDLRVKESELSRYADIDGEKLAALAAETEKIKAELAAAGEKREAAERECAEKRALYSLCLEYTKSKERVAELESRAEEIENLKTALLRAEKAEALLIELEAAEKLAKSAGEKRGEAARCEAAALRAKDGLAEADAGKTEEKIAELSARISNLKLCGSDVLRADELEKERKNLLELYRKKEAERQSAISDRGKLAAEKEKIEREMPPADGGGEDYAALVGAKLSEEYGEALNYFSEKKTALTDLADESEAGRAYAAVLKEVDERIAHYERKISLNRHAGDFDAALASVREKRENAKKREALTARLGECRLKIAELEGKGERLLSESESLAVKGREIRDELLRLREKINSVTGGADYSDFLKTCEAELDFKLGERDLLKERALKLRNEAEEFSKRAEGLKIAAADDEGRYLSLLAELDKKTAAAGLGSRDNLRAFAMDGGRAESARRETESYGAALAAAKLRAEELGVNLGGRFVTEEELEKTESFYRSLKAEELNLREIFALKGKELKDCEKSLAEKVEKTAEYDIIKNKSHTAETLLALVKNKALLEFACDEYLKDIAEEASQLLASLTGGRYFLTYAGDFFVEDNLSGGERRPVNSLSGGETFLVSLSLAVALSTAIYSKSDKPVEFFFLDEGFGTLDEELTDVVIDCLEKLRKNRFSIGLISHVQELKQRISAKILVTGADAERGSTVKTVF